MENVTELVSELECTKEEAGKINEITTFTDAKNVNFILEFFTATSTTTFTSLIIIITPPNCHPPRQIHSTLHTHFLTFGVTIK